MARKTGPPDRQLAFLDPSFCRAPLTLAAEAAQRNPNSARNFYLTARALSRLGRPELAIKWLKRSIELDPAYAEPHYLLAQLYSKRGLREQSEKEFEVFHGIRTEQPTQRR